ncbi:MAG: PaaI family thioesterase [Acidimicrobiales bacterium]
MAGASRARVAAAIRRLGHGVVAHEVADDDLAWLADELEGLAARVVASPPRRHRIDAPPGVGTSRVGEAVALFTDLAGDALVAGATNPLGLGARFWLEGDTVVMEAVVGPAFAGAPGRAHGGILATLIDETMGTVLAHHDVFALTAWLHVTFTAAAPLGQPVTARAWLADRDGRKLTIQARVVAQDTLVAEAEALFVAVDPRPFLAGPPR